MFMNVKKKYHIIKLSEKLSLIYNFEWAFIQITEKKDYEILALFKTRFYAEKFQEKMEDLYKLTATSSGLGHRKDKGDAY